jgi:predicted CoA-binding protein
MQQIKEAAAEFLAHKRVAVTGVSRDPKSHGSNAVYKRLRERGYDVFAVNPNAKEVEAIAPTRTCVRFPVASMPW